ncbi:TonB-dependent receptor plug domain-containing protein [Agaribacterium sp. ZY112]|uniref:TonB-dependent receptor plug domain-containing protein n=1 Tax=Agaribacterium sp. ZY112 TaxID=3233574 RepID=UPI0035244A4D
MTSKLIAAVKFKRQCLVFLFFLIGVNSVWAEGGSLSVFIEAEQGASMSSVELQLLSRDGELRSLAFKDANKEANKLRFDNLAEGLYELSLLDAGLKVAVEPSVRVRNNKVSQLTMFLPAFAEEELLVLAGRARSNNSFSAPSSASLDREELRSAAGSGGEVLRALDGLPGLVSTGDFASFSVRGRGPDDNLILVDGVPFPSVTHFQESVGEQEELDGGRYSIFAPNLIGSADFQPGGWSSQYSGRSGSLLNLNVATGNTESPSFSVRLDLAGPEFTYDGPSYIDDDTSVLFSARSLDFGRFFETIGIEDIGSPELTDIIFKTSTQLSDGLFDVLLIHTPETYERNIDNVLALNDDDEIDDVLLVDSSQDNDLASVRWLKEFDLFSLDQRVFYRQTAKRSAIGEAYPDLASSQPPTASNVPVKPGLLVQDENQTEYGWFTGLVTDNRLGAFQAGFQLSRLDVDYRSELKEDWVRYVYDQNDYRPDPSQKYLLLEPEFINNELEQSVNQLALYADQLFDFGALSLRAGARYDYDEWVAQSLLSPRFAADWALSSGINLSASFGRYYQIPDLLVRARSPANAELESEQTDQLSFGLSKSFMGGWNVLSELYYQQLSNLITSPDRATGISSNEGEGYSQGLDLVLNRYFSERWSMNVSYSFNQSEIDSKDGFGRVNADYQRPHALGLGGVFELTQRWKFSARYKLMSGRPDSSYIVNDNVLGDGQPLRYSKEIVGRNDERFDMYSSLNFRVDYQRSLGPSNVVAFLDVINALGSENTNQSSFNERTGELNTSSGRAFPLIGLRFDF